jgi:hypothetical protein
VTPQSGRITAINLTPRLNYTFENGDTLTAQTFVNMGTSCRPRGRVDTLVGPLPAYPALDQTMSNDNHVFRQELNWVHKFESGAKLDAKLSGSTSAPTTRCTGSAAAIRRRRRCAPSSSRTPPCAA